MRPRLSGFTILRTFTLFELAMRILASRKHSRAHGALSIGRTSGKKDVHSEELLGGLGTPDFTSHCFR